MLISLQYFVISIVSTRPFLFSGHVPFYLHNTYDRNQLTRLPWYYQNPSCLGGHHAYVTSENDTNTIEIQEVLHKLTTQEARGLQYHQVIIVNQQDYSLQFVIY